MTPPAATARAAGDVRVPRRRDRRRPTGPVEIDLWHTEIGLNVKALQKIVDRYEASQDKVKVNLQYQGTFEEQLKKYEDASADPDSLPDIVSPDDTVTQFMADSGTVIPVQSCIDADPEAKAIYDDMVPIVDAAYTHRGRALARGVRRGRCRHVHQRGPLHAAGLDPETDQPETLAQLRSVAEKIKAANIPGRHRAARDAHRGLAARVPAPAARCSPWSTTTTAAPVWPPSPSTRTTPPSRSSSTSTAWSTTDCSSTPTTRTSSRPYLSMATQTSSMLIDSSSAIRTVDGAVQGTLTPDQLGLEGEADLSGFSFPTLRLTVGELPGLTEPGRGQMGGAAWYIVAGDDDAKVSAAWDFMKYFNQTEQQVTWAVDGSSFPVRQSATEDPELQKYWTDTQSGRWMAEAYKGFTTLDPDFPGPVIGPVPRVPRRGEERPRVDRARRRRSDERDGGRRRPRSRTHSTSTRPTSAAERASVRSFTLRAPPVGCRDTQRHYGSPHGHRTHLHRSGPDPRSRSPRCPLAHVGACSSCPCSPCSPCRCGLWRR